MTESNVMETAEAVVEILSGLRGGAYLDARPVQIKIENPWCISFRMYTGEDEPDEDEDDDREWNLSCSTSDLLDNLSRSCREKGLEVNLSYRYCDVRNEYYQGIFVDACINLDGDEE